jgi:transcriptional regulator with XRE-family HTH domain
MRGKQPRPPRTLGELIAQRRQELGLRQVELALRIKGRSGESVTQAMIANLERDSWQKPGLALLEQLPRALKLAPEVIYFWGGQIPPDIRPGGLSETTIKQAWAAMRAVIARARTPARPMKSIAPPASLSRPKRKREPGLQGWQGRKSLGGLIGWRRRKLGLTMEELNEQIRGEHGAPLSKQRLNDIEHDRGGIPRRPLLRQLARALKLNVEVLYLWAGRLPPDIRPAGLSEKTIEQAWSAFRAVIARARRRRPPTRRQVRISIN